MIRLTIKNTANNEVLNQTEIEPSALNEEKRMWETQIQLYELEGIQAILGILDLDAPEIEID